MTCNRFENHGLAPKANWSIHKRRKTSAVLSEKTEVTEKNVILYCRIYDDVHVACDNNNGNQSIRIVCVSCRRSNSSTRQTIVSACYNSTVDHPSTLCITRRKATLVSNRCFCVYAVYVEACNYMVPRSLKVVNVIFMYKNIEVLF